MATKQQNIDMLVYISNIERPDDGVIVATM